MSWIHRFTNLFRSRWLSSGIDEELQFHLDARTRDNIKAGMNPQEARQDAISRFGNQTLAKESTREKNVVVSMETVAQDLRYALRSLSRSPGFAAVVVVILALGIGANTAVFTVVSGVLLRPLPYPEPGRLFLISYGPREGPFGPKPGLADQHYIEFQRQNQQFEHIASFSFQPVTLTGAGDPVRVPAAAVTLDFPRILRVSPTAGRIFLSEEDQSGRDRVVLLSDKLWHSRFGGDLNVLGKTISLDGVGFSVIGIMPPGFTLPYDAELWMPLSIRLDEHNSFIRPVVGRLKAGISQEEAQASLEVFAHGLPLAVGENREDFVARIIPLKDLLVGNIRKSLLIFAGAVAFVLLIACANVANLLLIRAASRRQEIAVRAALGASRGRLIRQLLTESTLLSLCGGAAGTLLALWGVPVLLAMAPGGKLPRIEQIHIDVWVLAFNFGLSVLTGVAFGLAPAFRVTRQELRESLSEGTRTLTGRHEGLRSTLAILEVGLAFMLLAGAGLMLKSFLRMRAVDPGFRPENILTMTVDLPESQYRSTTQIEEFHERTLAKLASLPGVLGAAVVNWIPFGSLLMKGDFRLEGGRQLPRGYLVDKPSVSPDYFRVMGIRVLRGRSFSDRDTATAPGVAVISQSVARRLWPGEDPIGHRIVLEDRPKPEDWLTIVGVVDDVRQEDLTKPNPAIYQPSLQVKIPFFLSRMTYVVRTASNPTSVASAMRSVLRQVDKNQPVQSITTMEDMIATRTAEPRFQTRLLGTFSILALLLSATGIYGVLAYSVTERTHEIGIRMALGAEASDVLWMVLRRTLMLVGVGTALGIGAALTVTGVLQKFLFDVKPTDPATFIAVAALLVAVAILAGLLPALRATRVDPLVSLRHE